MDPRSGPPHVKRDPPEGATAALFDRQRFGIEPGLERIAALLDRLGRPQDAFASILIAGTNGKGGTAAHLDAMLRADAVVRGGSVGRTVSPHLVEPGERIAIDGRTMASGDFERLAAEVAPYADEVGATFFETVTAMALLAFARGGVERAVVEVGLGGRWDATNVLEPVACAIGPIALDHQAILGDDLATIAREKAGILRSGVPAWSGASGPARAALIDEADRRGAPLRFLDVDAAVHRSDRGWEGSDLRVEVADAPPLALSTPLVGAAQASNAVLAALTARDLGVGDQAIARGASRTAWPGRMERLDTCYGRVLLDGAHNAAAAAGLAEALGSLACRPHLVLGMAEDKDARRVIERLASAVRSIRFTRAGASPRAAPPERLAGVASDLGLRVAGTFDAPIEALREAAAEARADAADGVEEDVAVLVAGSLYLVGEVRAWSIGQELPAWERWQ